MDSGDEMADAAYRSMQQSAQDFMRWMTGYGRMGGRGSNLLQRMTDRSLNTLSLHDALPIYRAARRGEGGGSSRQGQSRRHRVLREQPRGARGARR